MSDTETKVTVRIRPYRGAPEHTLVFYTHFKTDKAILRVAQEQVKTFGYEVVRLSYSRTLEGVSSHV